MQLGDIVNEKICIGKLVGSTGQKSPMKYSGTVVYIHPKRRFYVVEFKWKHGNTFRESYLMKAELI